MQASSHALVLLSGGVDSTTCLAVALDRGYGCYALSFRYGQRHEVELQAAARIAKRFGVLRHLITDIDLRPIGGSALTDEIIVPKARSLTVIGSGIPATYVPARNTIFLSIALAWGEVLNVFEIFIGVNCTDYSGYPDCRPEYIAAFETMANLSTKASVEGRGKFKIHTPLIALSKVEIIRLGTALGVDYTLTHSCYDPNPEGQPCGRCDSCQLRDKGFAEAFPR